MDNFSVQKPFNGAPTGIATFAKCPICTDLNNVQADIAIIGAPFDLAIQGRTGSRLGPRGIRIGSTRFSFKPGGSYDPERDMMYMDSDRWRVVDCGDVDYVPGDLDITFANLTEAVRLLVSQGVMPVVLGGDHSITYPVLQGMEGAGNFNIIHFDAHLDWSKSVGGQWRSNGSPMRNSAMLPYVGKTVHLGIRGIGSSQPSDFDDAKKNGDIIYFPRQIHSLSADDVINGLDEGSSVYVTFDIDAMDASCAPATGSPMFGGLWYDEVVDIFQAIAARYNVIGMDMVEVAPVYDGPGDGTSYLAARLIADLLGFVTKQKECR